MGLIRIAKTAFVASVAALLTVIVFGNITDYGTNLAFVQHVMAMDTLFPTTTITYRAITNPTLQYLVYDTIIAVEATVAVLCWAGAFALLRALCAPAAGFNRAKALSVAGLALGFLLYQFGFMTVGGEWFGMWMSEHWNGIPSAFRFMTTIMLVLIFVAMPDGELDRAAATSGNRSRDDSPAP
jgi:predicted small integral membrane protein